MEQLLEAAVPQEGEPGGCLVFFKTASCPPQAARLDGPFAGYRQLTYLQRRPSRPGVHAARPGPVQGVGPQPLLPRSTTGSDHILVSPPGGVPDKGGLAIDGESGG